MPAPAFGTLTEGPPSAKTLLVTANTCLKRRLRKWMDTVEAKVFLQTFKFGTAWHWLDTPFPWFPA